MGGALHDEDDMRWPLLWTCMTASALIAYNVFFERHRAEYRLYRNDRRMFRLQRIVYALLWFILVVNVRYLVMQVVKIMA